MIKLENDGTTATEAWRNNTLENRMGGFVVLNNQIIGLSDKVRKLESLDWATGNEMSSLAINSSGNIISAEGLLYLYTEAGNVSLVETKTDGFNLISSFKVPYGANQHWSHLVINNKKLFVRHGTSLMVYDIAAN
jgi:hypothetical protein